MKKRFLSTLNAAMSLRSYKYYDFRSSDEFNNSMKISFVLKGKKVYVTYRNAT